KNNDPEIDSDVDVQNDCDYTPSDSTASSSESVSDLEIMKNSKKRKHHEKVRDKDWKRKGKKIKVKKNKLKISRPAVIANSIVVHEKTVDSINDANCITLNNNQQSGKASNLEEPERYDSKNCQEENLENYPSRNDPAGNEDNLSDTEKAIRKSKKEKQILDIVHKYHTQKLDKILASNMLERKSVPADGNCLFASALFHTQQNMSVEELRARVVDHLVENSAHYICFANVSEPSTEEEEHERFIELTQEIKEDGAWNSDMSDLVPLCLANIFKRPLRIFSSRPFTPVFDVVPDLVTPSSEDPLLISHLAIRGSDHYDAVIRKTLSTTRQNDKPQQMNSSQPTAQTEEDVTLSKKKRNTSHDKLRTPTKCAGDLQHSSPMVTPHKDAHYQSPKRKKLTRKKTPKPEKWKANVRKEKRMKGVAYENVHGKLILGREVKPINCSNCRFKCSLNITTDHRQSIFETYWGLGNYDGQRNFICQHVDQFEPERVARSKSRRKKVSNTYSFTNGQEKIRVCKEFFLKTLDVGKKTVDYALKSKNHGVFAGKDKRGSGPTATKISESDVKFVHEHINSFATVDSHYTRKDTKRKYLSQDLNIRRMYTLYVEKCSKSGRKPVSEKKYRDVFCNDYNLSFFHPKKDQCQICTRYEHLKSEGTLDAKVQKEYDDHQQRKLRSRQEKEADKKKAKTDPNCHVY
ncbi:MAG: OTU domain-containing protein, partial [Candidatus Thiodiazotropha sp.]